MSATTANNMFNQQAEDDLLMYSGPETWESCRRRLNLKALITGKIKQEAQERAETIRVKQEIDIIDLTED